MPVMGNRRDADEANMVQTTILDSGQKTCLSGPQLLVYGWRDILDRPAAFGYAILVSGRAWMVATMLVLSLVLLIQPIVRGGLNRAFPPSREGKFFGLVKKDKPSKTARLIFGIFALAVWTGAGVIVVSRFRGELPEGIAAAERRSRLWERHADALLVTDWQQSRRLYRGAALLTLNRERIDRLRRRVVSLVAQAPSSAGAIGAVKDTAALSTAITPSRTKAVGPGNRYTLEQKLGEGAMGVVYRGRDGVLERTVALKQLSGRLMADAQFVARFTLEARALARLSHPSIVQVYDLVAVDDAVWMVLEYVDGGTLADLLRKRGRLEPAHAAEIVSAVAEGLAVAHGEGIVHRDIKPANILMTGDGKPKLTDFGIAKLASAATLTQAGATLGSPAYMSPEQCNGETLDHRSDIYSLGITLYELLAGRPPFAGDTTGILAQHLLATPEPMATYASGIPEALEQLVGRMLAKKREERVQSMREVRDELRSFAGAAQIIS